jgi:hypothetical protein
MLYSSGMLHFNRYDTEVAMIEIRYTPPNEIAVAGTVEELHAVQAGILHVAAAGDSTLPYRVAARTTGSPVPYTHWLPELIVMLSAGAIKVSVIDTSQLMISGAADELDVFASFWSFETNAAPHTHTHHEYFEGNSWIEPDYLPLVIGVK